MPKAPYVGPLFIEDDNLSLAWGRVVRHVVDHTGREITPLIVSVTGFDSQGMPDELSEIRDRLDKLLAQRKLLSVEKVAFTIFPQRYWQMSGGDRSKLFDMYKKAFPRLQKMNRANRCGLYFERLTMYSDDTPNDGNQLETVIQLFGRNGGQRMQRQASVYDPVRDQTGTWIQGFPCLQHVTFVDTSEGMVLNAFYSTQQLFVRAYGNLVGLAHLGAFMANEVGLKMGRLNVFVGIEKLEKVSKSDHLISEIVDVVDQHRKPKP